MVGATRMKCKCGCGREVTKKGNRYIWGHNHKGKTYEEIYGDLALEKKEKRKFATQGRSREDMIGEKNPAKNLKVRRKIVEGVKKSWNYPGSKERREDFVMRMINILKGKPSWNKGKKVSYKSKSKRRKTMEENGFWVKEEDLNCFELYKRKVKVFTDISIKEKYSGEELKTRGKFKNCGYKQIDHIFSIIQGFKEGILPQIIGSKSNIRLLDAEQNWTKQHMCHVDKSELFRKYEEEVEGKNI